MAVNRAVNEIREVAGQPVEIRRSARRRRSVQAYRDGDRIVVLLPAALGVIESDEWVERMVARVVGKEQDRKKATPRGDRELTDRARQLSERYLQGRAVPSSIRWVTNQNSRWGSCTPSAGTIRLSHRLQEMPPWVIDSVIIHELAHLLERNHGPRFRALVERYDQTVKAEGFLDGVSFATGVGAQWEDDAD